MILCFFKKEFLFLILFCIFLVVTGYDIVEQKLTTKCRMFEGREYVHSIPLHVYAEQELEGGVKWSQGRGGQ